VTEVVGRNTRTGPDIVVHRVLEDPQRAAIQVALEVASHLVGVVAKPVRLRLARAAEQQARRLDSAGGNHHVGARDE
jgi:hypothetical protein